MLKSRGEKTLMEHFFSLMLPIYCPQSILSLHNKIFKKIKVSLILNQNGVFYLVGIELAKKIYKCPLFYLLVCILAKQFL